MRSHVHDSLWNLKLKFEFVETTLHYNEFLQFNALGENESLKFFINNKISHSIFKPTFKKV